MIPSAPAPKAADPIATAIGAATIFHKTPIPATPKPIVHTTSASSMPLNTFTLL
jgi:hypothetical protein